MNTKHCLECGTALPSAMPGGLCSTCALRGALAFGDDAVQAARIPEGTAPTEISTPLGRGQKFGDYELLEEIAHGGMGVVYKARQLSLDRVVAVKMLLAGLSSPEYVRRFRTEASAAASLQHPHIVAIHEVGVWQGWQYLVMDYVEGHSLAQRISDVRFRIADFRRSALWMKTVAEAVQYAHEHGILHRDLKPSNVLIDAADQLRVTDFGLAKRFEQESQVTLSGQVLGSPSYMPPEQAEARRGKVSRRSDVYGLGATLYHLLTGRAPFQGETPTDVLHQVLNADPVAPRQLNPSIPRDLETICLKCMEKEPARRYANAQTVAEELGRFLAGEPVVAHPVGPAGKAWRWCRRKPVVAGLSVGLLLALILGLAGVTWQWRRAEQIAQAEARQREQAEANAYTADMNQAQRALQDDDLGKAQSLLARYRPGTGLEHLRGFEWRYLTAEARSDMAGEDNSSPSAAFRAAFSPDGRTLAVGRYGGAVELWDVALMARTTVLETDAGFAGAVAVAFAPWTNLLAVARPSGIIRLWQLEPRRIVGELRSSHRSLSLSFSSDQRYLASYQSGGASVWDLERLQLVKHFPGPVDDNDHTGKVCFAPGGRFLALGELSGQIRILEVEADDEVLLIAAHEQGITSLAFSPDGKLLASASGYRTDEIRLWNVATGELAGSLPGHRAWVSALHFSADGRRLYSGSADQTIRIWAIPGLRLEHTLRGHKDEIWTLAFTEYWTNFISGCKDGTLAWWELGPPRSNALRREFLADAWQLGYVDRDSVAFCLNKEGPGPVALWRPSEAKEPATITALGTNNRALATAPERGLVAAADAGVIRVWSQKSATVLTNLVAEATRLGFSRNGEFLLSFNEPTGLSTVWDAGRWTRRFSHAETNTINTECVSPDGQLLVLVLSFRRLAWWDTLRGRQIAETPGHRQGINSLDFSPDGRTLASASWDGTVVLWDTRTQRQTAWWKPDLMAASAVAFSPDGMRLAIGHSDGRAARLWDVKTRRELITLQAPGGIFQILAFSPDGNALLSAERPGHAYVWRPPSFAELDMAAKAAAPR
jgi:WD40 repeat protein